jgi:hypothetical protein
VRKAPLIAFESAIAEVTEEDEEEKRGETFLTS